MPAGRFDFIEHVRGEVGGVMVVDDRRRAGVGESLAIAAPRPREPPVTRATRPSKGFEDFTLGSAERAVVSIIDLF